MYPLKFTFIFSSEDTNSFQCLTYLLNCLCFSFYEIFLYELISPVLVGTSWGFLLLLYVFVLISRVVVVGVLYPLLRHFGYGLDFKEAIILVWSGLRGAVALSLSLSVKASHCACSGC